MALNSEKNYRQLLTIQENPWVWYDFVTFSHPSLEGVIMWGFWEGRHWYPDAALYRKDWSIKPNGKAWEDLVLRQWRTEVTGKSDNKGKFSTRGFLGTYKIEVMHNGKKKVLDNVKLEKTGTTLRVVVD